MPLYDHTQNPLDCRPPIGERFAGPDYRKVVIGIHPDYRCQSMGKPGFPWEMVCAGIVPYQLVAGAQLLWQHRGGEPIVCHTRGAADCGAHKAATPCRMNRNVMLFPI